MKKILFSLGVAGALTMLLVCGQAGKSFASDRFDELSLKMSAGYRMDELDWNIAGDFSGSNPNVLSELEWEDLEIFQLRVAGRLAVENPYYPFALYIRGHAGYGWIVDGENQDSDYTGDNRTQEFSRSNNSADDGEVGDASVGIGPRFRFGADAWTLAPLIGYSYHKQDLTLTEGNQTVSVPVNNPPFVVVPPPLGPFAGLDSSYDAEWYGPWVGLDLTVQPTPRFTLSAAFEYHWGDYEAEANWNLRDDLAHPVSFAHDADGDGFVVALGGDFEVIDGFSLQLDFDYTDWQTDRGIDRVFLADGRVGGTRLNEVNWESFSAMFGLKYRFF